MIVGIEEALMKSIDSRANSTARRMRSAGTDTRKLKPETQNVWTDPMIVERLSLLILAIFETLETLETLVILASQAGTREAPLMRTG